MKSATPNIRCTTLAVPSDLSGQVIANLDSSRGADGARVIVEKLFGRNRASAHALNAAARAVFPDTAIFRIDCLSVDHVSFICPAHGRGIQYVESTFLERRSRLHRRP